MIHTKLASHHHCNIPSLKHCSTYTYLLYIYTTTPLPTLSVPINPSQIMPSNIRTVSKVHRIASIPGDGIGVDITVAAERVLHVLAKAVGGFEFDFTTFDWSSAKYRERGWYMPPDGIDQLKKFDAIYFGAVGSPGEYPSILPEVVVERYGREWMGY